MPTSKAPWAMQAAVLDESTRQLWLKAAARGSPPSPKSVAELEYGLVVNWHHAEAFLPLVERLDPNSPAKTLACIEASRGSGKSVMAALNRLYLCEWVLPFLTRSGLPIRAENRNLLVFGRDESYLRDAVLEPMKRLVVNCAPWLRTADWKEYIEDTDAPSEEGVRGLSEMRSKSGQRWESLRMDFANGISIRSRTLRQSARSFHVFWADYDDPLTEQNAHESVDIMEDIRGSVLPAIEPGGVLAFYGTPQMLGDLFDMAANNPSWQYRQYPARDEDGSLGYAAKNLAHLGASASTMPRDWLDCLWPARLNPLHLEQARGKSAEDESKFQREYMLKREQASTSLVHPDDLLAAIDRELQYQPRAIPGTIYFGGVDPSGLRRDEAGWCLNYVTPDNTRILAHLSSMVVNPHLQSGEGEVMVIDHTNTLAGRYQCFDWLVEGNGFQSVMAGQLRRLNPSLRIKTEILNDSKNTENGWLGLRTIFRNRLIRLPYKTTNDRAITDRLLFQLRGLQYIDGKVREDKKRKNDLVSALHLSIRASEVAVTERLFSKLLLGPIGEAPTFASRLTDSAPGGEGRKHRPAIDRSTAGVFARIARARQRLGL